MERVSREVKRNYVGARLFMATAFGLGGVAGALSIADAATCKSELTHTAQTFIDRNGNKEYDPTVDSISRRLPGVEFIYLAGGQEITRKRTNSDGQAVPELIANCNSNIQGTEAISGVFKVIVSGEQVGADQNFEVRNGRNRVINTYILEPLPPTAVPTIPQAPRPTATIEAPRPASTPTQEPARVLPTATVPARPVVPPPADPIVVQPGESDLGRIIINVIDSPSRFVAHYRLFNVSNPADRILVDAFGWTVLFIGAVGARKLLRKIGI